MIGTPASIRASVEQTEPIDDEPFDSSVSETIRIVYGNSSADGITASRARCASAPWPMSRRFGPRMKPVSHDRVGREVVVVHVAAVGLEREVVDPLALLGGAEGEDMICVWPRVKSADPCVRGADAHLALDRADLLGAAAVRAPLVDGDLLADEVFVDRVGGLLDVLLREVSRP